MKNWLKNFSVPLLWTAILLVHSCDFFFWDTIQLASKHAHFFYENRFSILLLPENIDSGHPPFYGILLALWWMIFGKSLLTSHFFNILIVLCGMWQAHLLGEKLWGSSKAYVLPLMFFCTPFILGHSILVSPDNLLMLFFLFSLIMKLTGNTIWLSIGLLGLGLVSMRGGMIVAAFFMAEVILHKSWSIRSLFILCKKYFPVMLWAFIFYGYHWYETSWLVFHEHSPWAQSFELVNLKGYLYNLGLILWRLLDFGNVFIWTPLIGLILFRSESVKQTSNPFLLTFMFVLSVVFIFPLAAFQFLSGHRYFIPIIVVAEIVLFSYLLNKKLHWMKWVILVGLFMGNLWIYPNHISQGWDVTLGHTPFYRLVSKTHQYLEENGIASAEIGTAFPLRSASKYLYLDENMPSFHEFDLNKDRWILYSNVMNDFKDDDLLILKEQFVIAKEWKSFGIEMILYERSP